jgi:DNA-binding beta-propeller fold protein YncE
MRLGGRAYAKFTPHDRATVSGELPGRRFTLRNLTPVSPCSSDVVFPRRRKLDLTASGTSGSFARSGASHAMPLNTSIHLAAINGFIIVSALCVLACGLSACDRHPSKGGVTGVIGELGMAPGSFNLPRAIAVDDRGSVFVVDKSGRVQRFSPAGELEAHWMMPLIEIGKPVGLSVHPDGRLFVADTHESRVAVFDRDGALLETFGEEGDAPGRFRLPTDVAFDQEGFIYVAEYNGNDRISKWTPELQCVAVLADQPIEGLRLKRPSGIGVDGEQTLWVSDACNHRVIRLSREGEVLLVFGGLGSEPGQMRYPYDLCITPQDTILICEYEGNRLQWFDKEGRSLGVWGRSGRAVGDLFFPWGAAYGPDGNIYIADSLNHRVQVLSP